MDPILQVLYTENMDPVIFHMLLEMAKDVWAKPASGLPTATKPGKTIQNKRGEL